MTTSDARQVPVAAALDTETVEQLAECGLLAEIADLYVKESQALLARLEAAQAAGDPSALGRAAHALRGASGSVGARRVAALCSAVEGAVRAQNLVQASATAAEVRAAVAEAAEALARRASTT